MLSFVSHWCQHFFEYYPNPPVDLLLSVTDMMKSWAPNLHRHLEELGYSFARNVWGWYRSVFTNILSKDHFYHLVDFLVLNHESPDFMVYFPIAYFTYYKKPLMKVPSIEKLAEFLSTRVPSKFNKVILLMEKLREKYPPHTLRVTFNNNLPLTSE